MSTSSNERLWARLCAAVPYGSSTCSKAARYLPEEPAVVERARGCRLWDVDGREFIDFRNGLGPITLGYAHPAVDHAIREQLGRGIVFGYPHRLEAEVAELVQAVVPCAERVRFLKTGGEAVAACFRLARACTGREHIVQIGYNGWLNSLAAGAATLPRADAGTTPSGVPASLAAVHHAAPWNGLPALEQLAERLPGRIAAVCVAASYADMAAGREFYPALREFTRREGALLIYDEIVTGFRVATGGVQEYFGTVPDLAVFAKGIANGMPLSVYCGRRDVMDCCDRGGPVVISSTYGGEALSLAAAKAVIGVYRAEDVIGHLWRQGEAMWGALNRRFEAGSIPLRLRGLWPCPQFVPEPGAPPGLLDRFFRAACHCGVTLYHVPYVNFSHTAADVEEALSRLDRALETLA
ncbi:MAG: aminotransferase class III-fold pyridoxal phosphate-dependent enzyme [Lentisphaeria bacterium]|nr:aminotransferase class III-fold pyridoxal phosphate-dependent enzyme [Lentisphaeria bacterium]